MFKASSLIATVSFVFFCGNSSAQDPSLLKEGPVIKFSHTKYNYGQLQESAGNALHKFDFTNVGNKPLVITNVHSSCGCTTPNWTQDTVYPGQSGFVETSYETINRVGPFDKTVTVYSNAANAPFVHLDIKGEVLADLTPEASYEPVYTSFYVVNSSYQMGTVFDNSKDTVDLKLINETDEAAAIVKIDHLPPFMKVIKMPDTLESRETGHLLILVDGTLMKRYGAETHDISITTNSRYNPYTGASISFVRKQYFPAFSAKQLAKQPKVAFSKSLHDFGTSNSGASLTTSFTIYNKGKKDLIIHEVLPDCSCLKVDYHNNTIAPGDSMVITLTWDTILKNGRKYQNVHFILNDPTTPEPKITVTAALPEKKNGGCLTCPK